MDFYADPKISFILGHPFLATGQALIDIATGQLIIRVHVKFYVLDIYKVMKLPSIYEELSDIMIIDLDSELPLITLKYLLERSLVGYGIFFRCRGP